MQRVKVVSSNIAEVGYDAETQTLEVAFKPNRAGIVSVWRYSPVPQAVYDGMLAEDASVGSIVSSVKAAPGIAAYKAGEEPQAVSA